ncbi:MAG: ABC transporter permease [Bacteroidales bacterium]|nr:ABC transporter permease [Bacteroidales bacterium]
MIKTLRDIWLVFSIEVRRVFSDSTVLLIFFIAPIIYPLLFCGFYHNESVEDLPVAVVDEQPCEVSKRFIRKIDATPELSVHYRCNNLEEAKTLFKDHQVRSIFYFPKDFSSKLAALHTARVVVFGDMSSFYYYKAALTGGNSVLIDEMHTIELERYEASGLTDEEATIQMQPVVFESNTLFNPTGGYGSFLLPALMILVLHQTIFLGICILSGDANENRYTLKVIPPHLRRRSVHRVTFGRSLCYVLIYVPLTILDLWFIPRWFHLPQLGNLYTILEFALPFVLAVVFFAMTIGTLFVRQKISPMLCFVFFSLILFFISGMVWPQQSMPRIIYLFSYLFPSTPGVQGYVKIASMGGNLEIVRSEYMTLWVQAGVYFLTATISTYIKNYQRKLHGAKIHLARQHSDTLMKKLRIDYDDHPTEHTP